MADNLAGTGRELDVSLPTILGEFKMLREASGILRNCATPYPLKPHSGTTVNIINYGKFQAYGLAEAVDMAQAQALADALTTVTPSEVGVQVLLPDTTVRRIADPGLESKVAQMMNDAYDAKEDGDGCDQLINFTPRLGSAGTCIGLGHLVAARSRLDIGNLQRRDYLGQRPQPAPMPWYCVLQPQHALIIAGKLIPLASEPSGAAGYGANGGAEAGDDIGPSFGQGSLSEDIWKNGPGAIGMIGKMSVKEDPYINVDSNDDASSACFSQEGLIWCEEIAPDIKPERDESRRIKELNLVGSYGWTVYLPDNNGVELLFDASLPTS